MVIFPRAWAAIGHLGWWQSHLRILRQMRREDWKRYRPCWAARVTIGQGANESFGMESGQCSGSMGWRQSKTDGLNLEDADLVISKAVEWTSRFD